MAGHIFFGKFDQEQRLGTAGHDFCYRGLEHRNVAGEGDHRGIDQFHALRLQLHQMLRGVHRLMEGGKVADPQHLLR